MGPMHNGSNLDSLIPNKLTIGMAFQPQFIIYWDDEAGVSVGSMNGELAIAAHAECAMKMFSIGLFSCKMIVESHFALHFV
jgi:hypothetical protein